MSWTIDYYSEDVRLEIDALPVGIRASYARLTELLKEDHHIAFVYQKDK